MDTKRQKKLWELPEWKKTRNRLLKNICEQCGKTNETFVLVHLKPFPKARQIGFEVRQGLIKELINLGKITEFELTNKQMKEYRIQMCPKCSSISLRRRKVKKPIYICNNCSFGFNTPVNGVDYLNYEIKKIRNQYYSEILIDYNEEINYRYNIEIEKYRNWYLSGEDTITYCKSCAFQHRKGRKLCMKCRTHYHSSSYESCFYCNSVLCVACNNNRVLNRLIPQQQAICRDCNEGKSFTQNEQGVDCIICKKNKVIPKQQFGKEICERCVLDGFWIDDE